MGDSAGQCYLIGGGIAALAAAVFLIRDAGVAGPDIHLFEADGVLGGSLDGSGNAETGFVIRGGRMFETHFACTFDLLREIPTLTDPALSVTDEIRAFTKSVVPSSNCRLVVDQARVEAPSFGLSSRDKWDLLRLSLIPEAVLGDRTIAQYFSRSFLMTDFWIMWCTMFAFQSWHSVVEMRRYMRRFMHLLPRFNRLEGIHRTRLNQYDSIVRPIERWLDAQQANIHLDAPVTDVAFNEDASRVTGIAWMAKGSMVHQDVSSTDSVLITLGSMTEDSTLGSMSIAPEPAQAPSLGSWPLWRQIARASGRFGRPDRFSGHPEQSLWESFTVTLRNPEFFEFMSAFTDNQAGTGGLVTFRDSGWLMSVVLAYQPHFANQDADTFVFWGYGLHPTEHGDAIDKPMLECSGEEILHELACQLDLGERAESMFRDANCIPCLMPYITSQFMPRTRGDRPDVRPSPDGNFAFIGQFCEMPDDTVFTVEYSVRSAQVAVYSLCGLPRQAPPLYRGYLKPAVLLSAMRTLLSNGKPRVSLLRLLPCARILPLGSFMN